VDLPALRVADRLERLWAWCEASDVGFLYVQSLPNIRWMTTFSGSTATAVVNASERLIHLFVDGRYVTQAEEQCAASGAPVDVCVLQQPSDKADALRKIVGEGDIVFDPHDLTVAEHQQLTDRLATGMRPLNHPFGSLRRKKDDAEIARIVRSALIADAALFDVCADGLTGKSEREIRNRLDALMLDNGADRTSFDTIVAGGPNSAMPHHRPSDRVVGASDVVIIDMGAEVEGYRSDMTRTYVPATASSDIRLFADVVREAQALGVASMGPGVDTYEVDAAVRAVFRAHGVEEYFVHGSGHGVGLVIHEEPLVNQRQRANLESGEVVTMEPGLYRVGVGGVRIEDLVLITADGREVLTHSPKELSCPQ
jgi:Xaa-Pro aminopeptidase